MDGLGSYKSEFGVCTSSPLSVSMLGPPSVLFFDYYFHGVSYRAGKSDSSDCNIEKWGCTCLAKGMRELGVALCIISFSRLYFKLWEFWDFY